MYNYLSLNWGFGAKQLQVGVSNLISPSEASSNWEFGQGQFWKWESFHYFCTKIIFDNLKIFELWNWTSNFDLASRSAIFMVRKQTLFTKCQFYEKKVAALGKRWRQNGKKVLWGLPNLHLSIIWSCWKWIGLIWVNRNGYDESGSHNELCTLD